MKFCNIYLIACLVFIGSCQSGSEPAKKEDLLEGKWQLVEGFRGGKKTESLEGTFFHFNGTTMSTNLPIKGATDSPFTLNEQIISQQIVNELIIDYTITELTGRQLKLKTNLRGLDFVFHLERVID